VKISALGDIIQAQYATYDLFRMVPGAEIHWCAEEHFRDLLALNSNVKKFIGFPGKEWKKWPLKLRTWIAVGRWFRDLRAEQYDLVIDIQGVYKSAFVTFFSKSKKKLGITWAKTEGYSEWFYEQKIKKPRGFPAIEQYRKIIATAFGYTIDQLELSAGLDLGAYPILRAEPHRFKSVSLLISGSSQEKYWGLDHWVQLTAHLILEGADVAAYWGDTLGKRSAETIQAQVKGLLISTERLGMDRLARKLSTSDLVIGHDSGVSHLAVAIGIPTVIIFGVTSPKGYGSPGLKNFYPLGEEGLWPGVGEVINRLGELRSSAKPNVA
jgi:heptosyltransferase-1